VREVLTALNTGHQGGCATVHVNALADLPARLAALGALAGMTPAAVAAQAVSALDAVVHLRRDGGRRYVAQVGAVLREPGDGWRVQPVIEVAADGAVRAGAGWAEFARRWTVRDEPREGLP